MKPATRRPLLPLIIAPVLIWHSILFYGLPLPVVIVLWCLLSIWLYLAGPAPAILAACSIALFTVALNAFISISGLERSIYYRPHELMKATNPILGETFKPNTQFSMAALFGDVEATEKAGVREPHEIAYNTDSLGFRNSADFHDQQLVLIGDSFVAGANDTQSCIITEWLRREHGVDAYNLGYPGDMSDYVRRVDAFRNVMGTNFKMALFVFEGNDYHPFMNEPERVPTWLNRYFGIFKNSTLWRYTRWLYLRGMKKNDSKQRNPLVKRIGNADMAFLSTEPGIAGNREPLKEESFRFVEAINALKPNLAKVFFIPVKYRVYSQWISPEPLPNMQWEYLAQAARQADIPAFDLTPALVLEAERLLPSGEYVYWRDDTHWNCNGMRVAAAQVAKQMHQH